MQRYGVTHVTKLQVHKDKILHTNLKKYGVKNVSQNSTIRAKQKATFL